MRRYIVERWTLKNLTKNKEIDNAHTFLQLTSRHTLFYYIEPIIERRVSIKRGETKAALRENQRNALPL